MCLETKVLVYGDCAVNQDPNAEELAQIAISSADTAKMFGIEPKIAMLSYSTGDSGKGEEVEKVRLATKIVKETVLIFSLKDLSNTMLLLIQLLLKPNYLTVK